MPATATEQDFSRPAVNDETGHCRSCGRDNSDNVKLIERVARAMYRQVFPVGHPSHNSFGKAGGRDYWLGLAGAAVREMSAR